ncbi:MULTISPECIES: Bug family tripartite tricarboxylate transporter substrate binding protein [Ramlibacter]|uniref:Tripartite tricarboxylate transporter substrate binding protein n=1 Tax=Ramlibacter pinisoli TaxID=2682844 RepID=A0A6N8IZV1_9BURK|nr:MULTISPECIES: tripartite tricarboxylate transporter substrate binding protein [Ramlibacter]MBA2962366.1 tripartite tricarboxylate transporter substrate binding protein [Ramlibacter sp. CGMCC 1.13660]MVQ32308.1 tripartite tricarboxylate transporter substrate binding protein [Ramlibacter pinisoli]
MRSPALPAVARRRLVLGGAMGLGLVAAGHAQSWPSRPIRAIVNSATGGLTDVVARLLGAKLTASLGQPFVVDNRPGAAGLLGAEAVAKAEPDGHTVGVLASAITVAPALMPGTVFDAARDLAPIALLMSTPLVLVTHPNSPYRTLASLVADARARPGQVPIASGGNATMTHLVAEQFQAEAGLTLIHIPYKGGGPALNDVLANQVPAYFDTLNTSIKLVQEGRLRALAVVAPQRVPGLPDVPTIAEAGYPGVQGRAWYALVAPAGTPAAIVARLNEEVNKALAAPEVRERMTSLGGTIEGGPPKVLAELIQSEVPRWARLVKDRRISL